MSILSIATLEAAGSNCPFYEEQRDYETRMKKRYDLLVFLVAVAVVAALVALVIAAAAGEYGVSAAGAVGTVVTGTAMGFVLGQRKEHERRMRTFAKAVAEHCG